MSSPVRIICLRKSDNNHGCIRNHTHYFAKSFERRVVVADVLPGVFVSRGLFRLYARPKVDHRPRYR